MPLPALVVLFILVPLAELYLILQVGDAIGVGWTLLLLVADSILGAVLLRSQGRAVWQRFSEALGRRQMPHREVVDGVLVIFGAAFLITPGFLTDAVGLLVLLPPTRKLLRRFVMGRLTLRVASGVAGAAGAARRPPPAGSADVDGTATEYDAPAPRLER